MSESTPEVGPWAREKLQALSDYLNFYTTALKHQHWASLIYVDAFAGAGQARLRRGTPSGTNDLLAALDLGAPDPGAEEFVRGSPRVALDFPNRFNRYIFIESDAVRVAELEKLRAEYEGGVRIELRRGLAQDEIETLLDSGLGRPGHRAVVFLDPFGMQVSWTTIERLAATRHIEVLLNFALGMAIQRALPRSAKLRPGWREAHDRFFGSPEWYDRVYEARTDLLGEGTQKRPDADKRLLDSYSSRLKVAFGYVSPARLIRNTKGAPLYYLIWAGPHQLGLKGARHILSKGESVE